MKINGKFYSLYNNITYDNACQYLDESIKSKCDTYYMGKLQNVK